MNKNYHCVGEVDYALSQLGSRKRDVFGITWRPNEGVLFVGSGYVNRVAQLRVAQGNQICDETTFQDTIIFRMKSDHLEPWYTRFTGADSLVASSFLGDQLMLIALIDPRRIDSGERLESGTCPLSLKLLFSSNKGAIAFMRNSEISRLWELEGNMLFNSMSPVQVEESSDLEGAREKNGSFGH